MLGLLMVMPQPLHTGLQSPCLDIPVVFWCCNCRFPPNPTQRPITSGISSSSKPPYHLSAVLLELPVPVVKRANLAGLQPSGNAVEVERMLHAG